MAMTEQEWLASSDGQAMLNKIDDEAVSERQARLFAVACCRQLWGKLGSAGRKVAEVAELYADELASEETAPWFGRVLAWLSSWKQRRRLESLQQQVEQEFGSDLVSWTLRDMNEEPLCMGASLFAYLASSFANDLGLSPKVQATLAREILGNPFRPVTINPAWRTVNVTALAQAIYDDRAFDRLPILADALEDAGCSCQDILNHCRQPAEHVRGCWVVDLVLGKE
jgi:hypothetical protein